MFEAIIFILLFHSHSCKPVRYIMPKRTKKINQLTEFIYKQKSKHLQPRVKIFRHKK